MTALPPMRWFSDVAVDVLDGLDLAVLLLAPRLDDLLYANLAGKDALRALGGKGPLIVPPSLVAAIEPLLQTIETQSFTRALPLQAPRGRHYFLRAKRLASRGSILAVLTLAVVREADLIDVLARRFQLSHRDARLATLVRAGLSNQEIARELGLKVASVKHYLTGIFATLEVRSRAQLTSLIEKMAFPAA